DLTTIDLSKINSEEGRTILANQVRDALLTHGFFYVVNHGYPQSQDSFPCVLFPILRLIALSLELPEETLTNIHNCNNFAETFGLLDTSRTSYPRSAEDEEKTNNVWLKGHTGQLKYCTFYRPLGKITADPWKGRQEKGVEEEVLNGVVVKHYN
ncbi:hypothetical protein ID866_12332, partial [Astraeus odoratus]